MRERVRDYAIGVGAALLALAVRAALEPWLRGSLPFLLAFAGVTLAVWRAGAGPGVVAALIGYVGSNLLLKGELVPVGVYGRGWGIALLAYALSSVAIIGFGVAIRRAHAQLLEEVAFRRRAEDEAIRSREALAVEDRRKSEFLATLAHELRNPLAPIRSALQVLRGAGDDANARAGAVDMMDRQVRHMVRLIDDLLDVSRISRDQLHLRREPLDLAAVMQAAVETCAPAMAAKGHRLQTALPPDPVWVDGDATRLVQVLANLLDNAAKYTPPRGAITVVLRGDATQAEVSVADTGVGIPPAALARVFAMFERGAGAEPQAGGLGIGLAISRRLAELHGGSLVAESAGAGQGSRFTLVLPRIPVPQSATPPPAVPAAAGSEAAGRRRILVVDDNVDAATAMADVLELGGHEVKAVFDGASALAVAASFRPEVALLDIGMPGMDGHELARRLASEPWAHGLVLVAVTGWGQEADRRRTAEAGFAHHLVKPVDPADLEPILAGAR